MHALKWPATVSTSALAPRVRRAVADAGRYAALSSAAWRGSMSCLALVASTLVSAAESIPNPKCGSDVSIQRLAQVSDYYPRFPQCANAVFVSTVDVTVTTTGKVIAVSIMKTTGVSDNLRACVEGLVMDLVKRSAQLSSPSQTCVFRLSVSAKSE